MLEVRLLGARALRRLYREQVRRDFPLCERRPLSSIERLKREGCYDTWGIYEGEYLAAYAFLWRAEGYSCALLDYLAVCQGNRGSGIGTQTLALLQAQYGPDYAILAEVEPVEPEASPQEQLHRRRRIAFYQRAGFQKLCYRALIFGVNYTMLAWTMNQRLDEKILVEAHRNLYESQLPHLLFRRMVHIPADTDE